jgi:hypothetical protein
MNDSIVAPTSEIRRTTELVFPVVDNKKLQIVGGF